MLIWHQQPIEEALDRFIEIIGYMKIQIGRDTSPISYELVPAHYRKR